MPERTVLVVEDEETLQAALEYNLAKEGYRVITASQGEEAVEVARRVRPNLVLLDIMLPNLDGLEVCRILRREMTVPIIILTAKDQEIDKVVGLEVGADDYITKPFSIREVLARVRAMLRRAEMVSDTDADSKSRKILTSGQLVLDLEAHRASINEVALDLKPKEFDLLAFLMAHTGRAFTRGQLLDQVWDHDYVGDFRTVDVHIRWLREKIEGEPGSPLRIITIRGVGYRFEG